MSVNHKRKTRRWPWILALLAIGIFVGSRSCRRDNTVKVSTAKAEKRTLVETVDENGKLYPQEEVSITADAGALVQELYIQEGDTVRKGQALALVKTEQISTVAARAAPAPDLKNMAPGGFNPEAIAKMLQSNAAPAMPTMKRQARLQTLVAPMSGVVSYLPVKRGDRSMGLEIARIAAINNWEIRADVGEADVVKLTAGNKVTIEMDALPDQSFTGTLRRIASGNAMAQSGLPTNLMSDVTTYKVFIEMALPDADSTGKAMPFHLRPGMNARVHIQTRTVNDALVVPINAVTTRMPDDAPVASENGSLPSKAVKPDVVVFVMDKGVVKMKKVSTGIQDMNYIEILSGLQPGEAVICEPYDVIEKTLADGMKVKVVEKKELFKKQ
jgi:HlyD family secretion protein